MRLASRIISIVFSLSLYSVFAGCSFVEHEFASAQSVDKKTRVSIRSFYIFPDYTVSFDVKTDSFQKRVVLPGDRMPLRAEIYLAKDQVGILICDAMSGDVQRNVDLIKGDELPFDQVRNSLAAQIVQKYRPTDAEMTKFDADVLRWFCGDMDAGRLPNHLQR